MNKLLDVREELMKDAKVLAAMADKRSVKQYLEDLLEPAIREEVKKKLKK